MPIKPRKNETETEWMARCVPEMINPAPGRPDKRPQDQAVAICLDIWKHRNDGKGQAMPAQPKQKAPPDMAPDADETMSEWMDRCMANGGNHDQCMALWDENKNFEKAAGVNGSGRSFAESRISAGAVNKGAPWSFSAEDGNALLGSSGDDWANYGKHFLGSDVSAPSNTKAHWKYPFAKGDTVYRSALTAIRQRAGQQKDDAVFAAAGSLISMIDGGKALVADRGTAYSLLDIKSVTTENDRGVWPMVATTTSATMITDKGTAYSLLDIKSWTTENDLRIIRGVATTPTPDRVGDIIEPMGVAFKNPVPLLWQHDTRQPIGVASMGSPNKDGISFEARIAKVTEPGSLKDRLDEAWQSIKAGLVKGVSIGFRSIENSFMKDGGIRFLKTELLELSLVTIPANQDATIETIKAFDVIPKSTPPARAVGATQPGATKQTAAPAARKEVKKTMTKNVTILEQITAFENKRAATVARMEELMTKASDAGQTLDDAESQEYDDGEAEVSKIDAHLKRLHALERANREAAKPITPVVSLKDASEMRSRVVSVKPNVPQGIAFTRYAMALAGARGNRWEALERAKQWDNTPEVALALSHDIPAAMANPEFILQKAAVGAGTTTDATWASPLIAYQVMASEFIELLRPATIVGRIPGLRRVPFNIQMPATTTGTTMGWVGENAPKPVSNMAFTTVTLRWAKAAGIVVMTDELVRFSNPAAESIVRQDMIAAMAQFLDRQFVDPTVAAVTNVSPASITNGATSVARTGTNQAAFVTDASTLLSLFLTNSLSTVGGVWIMSQRQALAFSLMLNALGQRFYPDISPTGGTLLGYPVIASENVPSVGGSPADGTPIIFAVAPEILLADDGQVVIDASNQASVNMDSAPDSPPSGSTLLVSLWQMNMTGLRAERWINWLRRRSTAVAYISNAAYA